MDEVIRAAGAERDAAFYRTHAGAELDLIIDRGGRRYGFEFKFADSPRVTRSMHIAISDLKLRRLWIVYPGDRSYSLSDRIVALPLAEVGKIAEKIKS